MNESQGPVTATSDWPYGVFTSYQPPATEHLRVLSEARLVSYRRDGTRRYYQASRDGIGALRRYVDSLWDDVLAAYAAADPHPPATARQPAALKRSIRRRR